MGLKTETGSITLGDNTYTATKVYLDCEGGGGGDKDMLQQRVDATNSCEYLFYQYEGDNVDFIAGLDTSNVTNMRDMFYMCENLITIPSLDTSNVTDMSFMFLGCSSLTSIPMLNTSKVTNMGMMFQNCSKLTTIPLLDTSKATAMTSMFEECGNLTSIPQLDASNVKYMTYIFSECSNLTKISMLNIGADLDISSCTKMTREAILEVLGNLKDLTGAKNKKLTLGSTLLGQLTEEDKAIATNKNWTLA